MKLEVGMYVRIQWGNGTQTISKCTNKVDMGNTQYSKNDFYIHTDKRGEVIYKSMIVKASHNLLGNDKEPCLIEVGDYVNGLQVVEIGEYHSIKTDKVETYARVNCSALLNCLYEEDIKSIVTKEQFESMSYKVGE